MKNLIRNIMDTKRIIEEWYEFINKYYLSELAEKVNRGSLSLNIDFKQVVKFNIELADLLLDEPEETIKAGEIALEKFDLKKDSRFTLRFFNLPKSCVFRIRDLRTEHIGKFVVVESVIRQTSDIRPMVKSGRYECPSCGSITAVLHLTNEIQVPNKCGCGRKGKFTNLSEEKVDCQRLKVEEPFDSLEGNEQPRTINVMLQNNLTSPKIDKRNTPGSRVLLNSIVKDIPIISRTGKQKTERELMLVPNYIEPQEETFGELDITPKQKKEIIKISKSETLVEDLIESYSPDIHGYEEIKLAIILQLFSGVKKKISGKLRRADFHVLLLGDPSAGKTQLIKYAQQLSPKSRYSSGPGTSGKGLTASVDKDEFMGGWMVQAGAMVLANKGILIADEIDKMSKEDRHLMHEGLSEQTVSVDRASIHATLQCETSLLAAGNPKHSRFDEHSPVAEQINLEPSLISRFDFVFVIKDKPNKEYDREVIDKILDVHTGQLDITPKIEAEVLKRYISYARQFIHPVITKEARDKIKEYYLEVRQRGWGGEDKAVPITARQGEGIIRVAEAAAKARLSEIVEEQDVTLARDIIMYSLKQVSTDPNTGELDIDIVSSGVSHSTRNKLKRFKEALKKAKEDKLMPIHIDDLIKLGIGVGLDEADVEEIIPKLSRYGDLIEVTKNKYDLG